MHLQVEGKNSRFSPKYLGTLLQTSLALTRMKICGGAFCSKCSGDLDLCCLKAHLVFSSKKEQENKSRTKYLSTICFFFLTASWSMESKASKVQLIDLCSSNKIGVDINNWMIIALKYWSTGKSTGG